MSAIIKNIIFDLGQVLLDLDKKKCLDAFSEAGFTTAGELLEQNKRNQLFGAYECGDITSAEFRNAVRSMCTTAYSDNEIDAIWNAMLVAIPIEKLHFLIELRKRYKVCLLSNTNEIHWDYIVAHFFEQQSIKPETCFDYIFLSYKMKEKKPNSAIYQKALETGNMKPEETLFIDDIKENCQAAAALGIQTIHFTPGRSLPAAVCNFLTTH